MSWSQDMAPAIACHTRLTPLLRLDMANPCLGMAVLGTPYMVMNKSDVAIILTIIHYSQ